MRVATSGSAPTRHYSALSVKYNCGPDSSEMLVWGPQDGIGVCVEGRCLTLHVRPCLGAAGQEDGQSDHADTQQ
jgi:hypothetical protein